MTNVRTEGRNFDRNGILALDPQAFGFLFFGPTIKENTELDDVAIVEIDGPLENRDCGWFDSYENILARVKSACAGPAAKVVLRVNSPGGEAAGCFETARAIRVECLAAGKPLFAYVESRANSGAYALACAAQTICLGATSVVGSIGVISTRVDYTLANEQRGVRVALITSGARKADNHPDQAISESELAATQKIVNDIADVFYALVADFRGLAVEAIAGLQARMFVGDSAVQAELADDVRSFDEFLAGLSNATDETNGDQTMATPYEKARAALEEAAKGTGPESEKAKKLLAAMDDDGGDDADKDKDGDKDKDAEGDDDADTESDDDSDAEGDDDADAEGDDHDKDGDKDKDKEATSTSTTAQLAMIVNKQSKRLASVEAATHNERRRALLKSRPDISKELRAFLSTKPLGEVRAILKGIPKPAASSRRTPITTVGATRGETAGEVGPHLAPTAKAALDARMGLVTTSTKVVNTTHKLQLGVTTVEPIAPATQAAR